MSMDITDRQRICSRLREEEQGREILTRYHHGEPMTVTPAQRKKSAAVKRSVRTQTVETVTGAAGSLSSAAVIRNTTIIDCQAAGNSNGSRESEKVAQEPEILTIVRDGARRLSKKLHQGCNSRSIRIPCGACRTAAPQNSRIQTSRGSTSSRRSSIDPSLASGFRTIRYGLEVGVFERVP